MGYFASDPFGIESFDIRRNEMYRSCDNCLFEGSKNCDDCYDYDTWEARSLRERMKEETMRECYSCPSFNEDGQTACTHCIDEEYPEEDMVNHPNHYTNGNIECKDAIKAALGGAGFIAYCKGNIIKYIWREEFKNGIEDMKKARTYLDFAIECMEENEDE